MPPLRPASRASSLVHSWAVPFWCAAFPPLLAISRCLAGSIDANPRSSFATVFLLPVPRVRERRIEPARVFRLGQTATDMPLNDRNEGTYRWKPLRNRETYFSLVGLSRGTLEPGLAEEGDLFAERGTLMLLLGW